MRGTSTFFCGTGEVTWSTGSFVSLRRRSTRSRRNQPLRSPGNVETMISSTRSSLTTCIAAVYGSGCTIWPWGVEAFTAQLGERTAEPPVGFVVLLVVALRRDDQERGLALRSPLADAVEQLVRENGLVRNHENIGRLVCIACDRDVRDRDTGGGPLDVLDNVAPGPPGALGAVGRHDDLVHRWLELRKRILCRLHGAGVGDEALHVQSGLTERTQHPVAGAAATTRGACPRRRRSPGAVR